MEISSHRKKVFWTGHHLWPERVGIEKEICEAQIGYLKNQGMFDESVVWLNGNNIYILALSIQLHLSDHSSYSLSRNPPSATLL